MSKKFFSMTVLLGSVMLSGLAVAQSTTTADPACMLKNADGTQTIDKAKCPDGMKPGTEANSSTNSGAADTTTTTSTSAVGSTLIVPPDAFNGGKVMSANDFIGKTVYTKNGDNIGDVNDLIVTDNGSVQAVILGVGGFLGMGEKNVAVSMKSIEMAQDGNAVRLVVDGTKEQFNAAPTYDRATRTYMK
jgi:sporulation protein YlmC with PRC-barrel domain